MKRLYLVLCAAAAAVSQLTAFGLGDLGVKLPTKPADLIPLVTGGGAAAFCNQAFKGKSGRTTATLICGSLGVLVGSGIKQFLQDREQVRLAEATNATLTTGKKQTLRTEEGNEITTELVKPIKAAEADKKPPAKPYHSGNSQPPDAAASSTQVATAADARQCGTVRQTVITKDNQRVEDTVTACKEGDTWVAA